MGYDVHITRRESWIDEGGPAITEAEFRTLMEKRPELVDQLWWSDGNIETKNPDHALIRKMLEIANEMGAKVVGDDHEVYTHEYLERISRPRNYSKEWLQFFKVYLIYGIVWFTLVWAVFWFLGYFDIFLN